MPSWKNMEAQEHVRAQPQQGTRPVGASGAQRIWTHIQTRHRFDSELARELPHSPERPRARSQNTSQIPPTLNLLECGIHPGQPSLLDMADYLREVVARARQGRSCEKSSPISCVIQSPKFVGQNALKGSNHSFFLKI